MSGLRGRLVVGQSGGITAVMNASLQGVIEEASLHPEIEAVYGARCGIEGLLKEDFIDLSPQGQRRLAGVGRMPGAALGSCRHKLSDADVERALSVMRAHNIRYFLYIGGNDSADTTHRLSLAARAAGHELRAIAIPKTIDNDLPCTDHCPGYGSAARFIALAAGYSGMDSRSMASAYQVKVMEVMGRNAGWLAAASALARRRSGPAAPHIICVPERPFHADRFLSEVKDAYRSEGYVLVVAGETLRDAAGHPVGQLPDSALTDAFGHPRLAGVAVALTRLVEQELGLITRWERPGTLQRSFAACVSKVDRSEAYEVGRAAIRYALAGETDQMVTLVREDGPAYRCRTGLAPISAIANRERLLPAEYFENDGSFVTEVFLSYVRPLIGPPLPSLSGIRDAWVGRLLEQGR
ncbi:MAG: 6-phosphofructokinase [Bacteroidetes bacterium]|nr:6-phosphofructokinase [Bacteroidota bacterium]MCL5026085.1 6-phosphofructokinase [Chloroflexota bacterium]